MLESTFIVNKTIKPEFNYSKENFCCYRYYFLNSFLISRERLSKAGGVHKKEDIKCTSSFLSTSTVKYGFIAGQFALKYCFILYKSKKILRKSIKTLCLAISQTDTYVATQIDSANVLIAMQIIKTIQKSYFQPNTWYLYEQ